MPPLCRPASADFLLCAIGACFAVAARAADVPVAVMPPKPVLIQPSAAMAAPPPVPEAADTAANPAAKGAKSRKVAKVGKAANPSKQQAKKPVAKPKAKGKQR